MKIQSSLMKPALFAHQLPYEVLQGLMPLLAHAIKLSNLYGIGSVKLVPAILASISMELNAVNVKNLLVQHLLQFLV
jgi:hypothetical protein